MERPWARSGQGNAWDDDEYPDLSRAIERAVPRKAREGMRPADLVRTHRDTAWCMARRTDAYLVYSMSGDAVELDLSGARGRFSVAWLDSGAGTLQNAADVAGGGVVTLTPPAVVTGMAWVGWLERK